jgi:predicted RNA-binding Zn-ribbon protein involved in translation (DUF1610 family)
MPLLMKCPACGKRFGVRLLTERLVDDERNTVDSTTTVLVPGGYGRNTGNPMSSTSVVTTERKTYELSYQCRNCGHRWSEKTTRLRRS